MHHFLPFLVNHLGLDDAKGAVRLFLSIAEIDWAGEVPFRDEVAELPVCRWDIPAAVIGALSTATASRSV